MKKTVKEVKNVFDLSDALRDVFNESRCGKMPIDMAKNLANVAGKLTGTNTRKMEYNKYMGITEPIPFFETNQ